MSATEASSCETSSTVTEPDPPTFYAGDIICGRWNVEGEIGRGGCGVVYQVSTVVNEQCDGVMQERTIRAAMKCEGVDPEGRYTETLRSEVTVLRRMQRSEHACRLYMGGRLSSTVNILIMSLVGRSLSFLRRLHENQRFSTSTAIRIGIECLHAIEEIHSIGYLHRDIKGGNFATGIYPKDTRQVMLLDFGFARPYLKRNENGALRHRSPRRRAPFLGTDRYCSLNCANRLEQGRRDDLWSWLFMLVEFIEGRLPWKDSSAKSSKLNEVKRNGMDSLLDKCPQQLYRIYDHLETLKYADRPNYEIMFATLIEICEKKHIRSCDPYDWEVGGRCHARFLEAQNNRPQLKELEKRPEDEPMESALNSDSDYFSEGMFSPENTSSEDDEALGESHC